MQHHAYFHLVFSPLISIEPTNISAKIEVFKYPTHPTDFLFTPEDLTTNLSLNLPQPFFYKSTETAIPLYSPKNGITV
jgi:hypothetical protein